MQSPSKNVVLTWDECLAKADAIAERIVKIYGNKRNVRVYGVPRGGHYVAIMVHDALKFLLPLSNVRITTVLEDADVVVDDITDSGETWKKIQNQMDTESGKFEDPRPPSNNPETESSDWFFALVCKQEEFGKQYWVHFPWESGPDVDDPETVEQNIIRILQYIGEDPKREGLRETPARVVKSYAEIFAGYKQTPEQHLKVFEDGACDEMVLLKDIEFYSVCEHHMQPFFGKAHIAYIPDGKVVGVSKLARILDTFARRLQIQERLTDQIVSALMEHLHPKGAACIIEAKHFCMVCRGVHKQNSTMITSSLDGVFRDNRNHARTELLSLIRQ